MVKGTHLSKESRQKISEGMKGIKSSMETRKRMSIGKKGVLFSKEHIENLRLSHIGQSRPHTIESRKKLRLAHLGAKCIFWKGGISPINESIRKSLEYRLWREGVFMRDNFTCQFCGVIGGRLNADHIKPFADYPSLRFELSNGRTLCIDCHKKTDTYGWKKLHRLSTTSSV